MQLPQPFDVFFMGSQTEMLQIQRHIEESHAPPPPSTPRKPPQVRFGQRGHKLPINAPNNEQLYTILVQSFEDLRIVTTSLARNGKTGFVNVMTQQGPRMVQLQDFLNQNGWS
jgi:hypothetical protein